MKTSKLPPPMAESDWARLVDLERRLESGIAAARDAAAVRLAAARAAASPDPAQLDALAAEEERVDTERHCGALARLDVDAAALVQRLDSVADERIDELARWVLQAALADTTPEAT